MKREEHSKWEATVGSKEARHNLTQPRQERARSLSAESRRDAHKQGCLFIVHLSLESGTS